MKKNQQIQKSQLQKEKPLVDSRKFFESLLVHFYRWLKYKEPIPPIQLNFDIEKFLKELLNGKKGK